MSVQGNRSLIITTTCYKSSADLISYLVFLPASPVILSPRSPFRAQNYFWRFLYTKPSILKESILFSIGCTLICPPHQPWPVLSLIDYYAGLQILKCQPWHFHNSYIPEKGKMSYGTQTLIMWCPIAIHITEYYKANCHVSDYFQWTSLSDELSSC